MRSALLAIHYQNDVLHPEGRIRLGVADDARRQAVIAEAARLLAGARAHRVPVVSVRIAFRPDYADVATNAEIWRRVVAGGAMQEGGWGSGFYEGLGPLPGELTVTHTRNDAFYASPLEAVLAALRPRRLFVAGIATHLAVESTVRHASDAGYEVVVAADACAAAQPEAHEASVAVMALLATVTTVERALASMAAREEER